MGDFRQLDVWKRSHELVLAIYVTTGTFPREEQYGLTSQIRRSASSIPANIAEGCGRNTDPELARFCAIASGSASELEYHLLLARDLKYMAEGSYTELTYEVDGIKRMLSALLQRLQTTRRRPPRPIADSR